MDIKNLRNAPVRTRFKKGEHFVYENKVIYTVYEHELPKKEGHLIPVTTILHAGRVRDQFFMTKGHYHEKRGTAEVYVILNGVGVLIMGTFKFDPFDTIPLILFIYILQILNYLEYIYNVFHLFET